MKRPIIYVELILWAIYLYTVACSAYLDRYYFLVFFAGFILGLFYSIFTYRLLLGLSFWSTSNRPIANLSDLRKVGSVILGIVYSIVVVAITFKALHWPGTIVQLILAMLLLLFTTIVSIVRLKKSSTPEYYKRVLYRNCIFCIVCIPLTVSAYMLIT